MFFLKVANDWIFESSDKKMPSANILGPGLICDTTFNKFVTEKFYENTPLRAYVEDIANHMEDFIRYVGALVYYRITGVQVSQQEEITNIKRILDGIAVYMELILGEEIYEAFVKAAEAYQGDAGEGDL